MRRTAKNLLRKFLSKHLVAHRIRGGPLRGYKIVTSWHDYPAAILGTTEAELSNWLIQHVHAGETWLDIGAHYGYISLLLCKLTGPQGSVVSVEPSIATAGCLEQTRRLNRLSSLAILPFGLHGLDHMEMAEVTIDRGMAEMVTGSGKFTGIIFCHSLDQLFSQLKLDARYPAIHGIKIDVEGMEMKVLAGMREMLAHYRPSLVVELHPNVSEHEFNEFMGAAHYRFVRKIAHGLEGIFSYVYFPDESRTGAAVLA